MQVNSVIISEEMVKRESDAEHQKRTGRVGLRHVGPSQATGSRAWHPVWLASESALTTDGNVKVNIANPRVPRGLGLVLLGADATEASACPLAPGIDRCDVALEGGSFREPRYIQGRTPVSSLVPGLARFAGLQCCKFPSGSSSS